MSQARQRMSLRDGLAYGLIAGAIWLGWQVVQSAVAVRAPPGLAIRVAPTAPEVLRRAAESELLAGRLENAHDLSSESLARSPFNARALRVYGLVEARQGREARADEILTLAGNWSLRDDPAHAWLVEYRLKRGDYTSSFSHADTLVRRREEMFPSVFHLFATAAANDPRAVPPLVRLLASDPPWRSAFLDHLYREGSLAAVYATVAVQLEETKAPLTKPQLSQIYLSWLNNRRHSGLGELRRVIGRPASEPALQNGGFEQSIEDQIDPFGWRLPPSAGIASEIAADDMAPDNRAFRLQYDGFSAGTVVEQLILLPPGKHVLAGRNRGETPQGDTHLRWEVVCAETGSSVASRPAFESVRSEWTAFQVGFEVPKENCSAQWLRLTGSPGDRRTTIVTWLDDLNVRPMGGHPASAQMVASAASVNRSPPE